VPNEVAADKTAPNEAAAAYMLQAWLQQTCKQKLPSKTKARQTQQKTAVNQQSAPDEAQTPGAGGVGDCGGVEESWLIH